MILLDANILPRMADNKDPQYAITVNAVFKTRRTEQPVIVPQSLHEFWAVASREKKHNGLEMDGGRANRWITRYRQMFPLIQESLGAIDIWQSLVNQFKIKGFRVHDAKYVAAMLAHGITKFMTHNVKHFQGFPIQVVDPRSI